MRDLDKNPYSPDEERIARWLSEKGIGGGDDPIGFLLASYNYIIETRNHLNRQLNNYKAKYGNLVE